MTICKARWWKWCHNSEESHGFWRIWIIFNIFMAVFGVQTLSVFLSYEAFALIVWAELSWIPKRFWNFGLYSQTLRCLGSLGSVKVSVFFIKVLKPMAGVRIKTCSNWNPPLSFWPTVRSLKCNRLNLLAPSWSISPWPGVQTRTPRMDGHSDSQPASWEYHHSAGIILTHRKNKQCT